MDHFHEWVKCLLEGLEFKVVKKVSSEILSNCGRGCIPVNFIEEMMKIWEEVHDVDVLVKRINDSWSEAGADAQIAREKGELIVEYGECYCPLVKESIQKLPSSWCECSRGWLLKLFEPILGENVEVELLESVKRGNEKCRFKIIW
jgi:predicted hydrocarbon binding protein